MDPEEGAKVKVKFGATRETEFEVVDFKAPSTFAGSSASDASAPRSSSGSTQRDRDCGDDSRRTRAA